MQEWLQKSSSKNNMKLLSRLFILIGILCYVIGIYNIWLIQSPTRLSFNKYSYAKEPSKKELLNPKRIIIESLGIDLPIIPSRIHDDNWETTDQGASYLVSSPIPGEIGNSIVYAHNWTSLFGNLTSILPGDLVKVEFDDGSIREFEVKSTSTVSPETYSILAPTADKRITLYTCTGFLDSERFVAVAIMK